MKVIAILPCYNEAQNISDLVLRLNELVGMSIVADDNSSDDTVAKAEEAGAYIVRKFGKRGFGSNTKSGIDEALVRECDIIVTLDGDGQHNPSEIYQVINPIEDGDADVVIGSRFLLNTSNVPKYREFGIKVITWLYNVGNKHCITDAQCCFRAYKKEVLMAMSTDEVGFTFSVETLIKARHMGFRIREVPVSVLYHKQFSQNSTLNPIRHGLEVALGTIRVRFKVELLPRMKRWW